VAKIEGIVEEGISAARVKKDRCFTLLHWYHWMTDSGEPKASMFLPTVFTIPSEEAILVDEDWQVRLREMVDGDMPDLDMNTVTLIQMAMRSDLGLPEMRRQGKNFTSQEIANLRQMRLELLRMSTRTA
jgi:hypothetical protein